MSDETRMSIDWRDLLERLGPASDESPPPGRIWFDEVGDIPPDIWERLSDIAARTQRGG